MFEKSFDFKNININLYDKERGFGFVTEENRKLDEMLQLPELNTGFDVPYWYLEENVTDIKSDEFGCYIDSKECVKRIEAAENRLIPLCFKVDVEHLGNYEVTLELYGEGNVLVFAGPRRLVYKENIETTRLMRCNFILNVSNIVPRGKTCLYENKSIDIAVLGENIKLSNMSIKKIKCPTLYIAGDSTVTDQSAEYPYDPGTSYSGWGQMISWYLPKGIAVSNHAHSGLTVESFRTEGHYAIIQSSIKLGDYLLIQFAHNDQKLMHLKAEGGYRDALITYIEETRARGAYPIIVTPLARNSWKADDGTYNDLLAEYADTCIKLGEQYKVPVIDLHKVSKEFIINKGLEDAKAYFYPKDFTHTNDYGAYKMAGFIVEYYKEMMEKNRADAYARLAGMIVNRTDKWEAQDAIVLPEIPEKYKNVANPNGDMELFAELERPTDDLTRVEALDMVIKSARFFPTNVFNDIYDDIVGHEWYAGTVECAYQNGIILPQMTKDKMFEPDKKVTIEEFLVFIMGGYKSRKEMPKEEACVLDDMSTMYCIPYVRAAFSLGVIDENEDLKKIITREHAANICKMLNI